jgi:hypothetical protein
MQKFPSKVDKWSEVILWLIISLPFWCFLVSLFTKLNGLIGQLFIVPISLLLLWFRFQTVYIIEGVVFRYKSGPIRGKIFIKDIYKIHRTTNDPFNSGNLSSDKISIRARKRGSINISPENKNDFIKALLIINPNIEIVD